MPEPMRRDSTSDGVGGSFTRGNASDANTPGVHRTPLNTTEDETEEEEEERGLLLPKVDDDMSWFTCETASLVSAYEVSKG